MIGVNESVWYDQKHIVIDRVDIDIRIGKISQYFR